MLILDLDIINIILPRYLSYKHLHLVYMSCIKLYKKKLNIIELENIYYTPKTNEELKESVNKYYYYNFENIHLLSRFNTIYITNMAYLFKDKKQFNVDLNDWIVNNVTNMKYMFYNCKKFNQSLNYWNVNNVTNMKCMFSNCDIFNQSLNCWNVNNVTNMKKMFFEAYNFNQNLNTWKIENVINIYGIFFKAHNFNKNLNNWNIDNIKNIKYMFK